MKPFVISLLLLCTQSLFAHQLTPSQALSRLQSTRHRAKAVRSIEKMALAHTEMDGDAALMYIMNREGGEGFVILGADDNAPALIGYTDSGKYDADNLPSNFRNWIDAYAQSISVAIKQDRVMKAPNVNHAAIAPLVTTEWDQLIPYNLKCTDRGSNFGVYTGCVATAMAQVINYHKYPERGIGEHTYTFPATTKQYTGYTNFSEHTYDWDNMIDIYASYGNPAGSEEAVATLMHDCGVAVNMNYNTTSSNEGSGANHNLVAQALVNYFGYDRSIRTVSRCYYSDDEWEEMMLAELEARRPVMYAGSSMKGGGHEFVLDGYDGNGCYHFNWGWSGNCNGYFLLTGENAINPYSGNPNYGTWGTDPDYAFNYGQAATIGIQPDKGTKEVFTGMGFPGGYSLNMSECGYRGYYLYVEGYLWNTGVFPQKVIMGLKYINQNDPDEVYYDESPQTIERGLDSYITSYYVFLSNIPSPGTYYAYPVFKDANDKNAKWQDVMLPYGYTEIPTFTWKGSQVPISMPTLATLTTRGNPSVGNQVFSTDTEVHFTINAHSQVSRELYLQLFTESDKNKECARLDEIYFNMNSGDTKDFDISLDKLLAGKAPGNYYLKIRTWNDNTIYPKYNSYIPLTIIDHLPFDYNGDGQVNLLDLTALIDLLHSSSSEYTLQDVQELVDKLLEK